MNYLQFYSNRRERPFQIIQSLWLLQLAKQLQKSRDLSKQLTPQLHSLPGFLADLHPSLLEPQYDMQKAEGELQIKLGLITAVFGE